MPARTSLRSITIFSFKGAEDEENIDDNIDDLLCDYCQQNADKNPFGEPEELLICKDCGNKGLVFKFTEVYMSSKVRKDLLSIKVANFLHSRF